MLFSAGSALAQVPSVFSGGVVNDAGFTAGAPVAPGSMIAIFGTNLATGTAAAGSVPLPTSLGSTSVQINGRLAPLYFVSQGQIDAQLPFEISPGSASVVVTVGSSSSTPVSFAVASSAPGLFLLPGGRGVAINQDGTLNAANNAAPSGTVLVAYLTGQGPVDNPVADGAAASASPLSKATAPASATIGGQNANILFLGLAPGFVGVLQANIQVPNLPSGDFPLAVTIGGAASNQGLVTISGTGSAPLGATTVRTLVYDQITSFPSGSGVNSNNGEWPVLSRNSNVAVFAVSGKSNVISTINTDGTNQRQVDSYTSQCYCSAMVDISDDGKTVISTESAQLRVAGATGASTLVNVNSPSIGAIRISGDGSKIFFVLTNDSGVAGTSTQLQRGLYTVAANGSGLRQLVGPAAVSSLVGAPAGNIYFDGGAHVLDISTDGSRIVFTASTVPNGAPSVMLGVNSDGSGLHQFPLTSTYSIAAVALSGSGARASYVRSPAPCCNNPFELVAINFDGSGATQLAPYVPSNADPLAMDTAGAWVHWEGVLYSTDGSTRFQTDGAHAGFGSPQYPLDSVSLVTMNGAATQFLYVVYSGQLATIHLNPASLGSAPSITNPTLTPGYILTDNGRSQATVTAKVGFSGTLDWMEANTFRNGLYDGAQSNTVGGFMVDDGTNGDVKAGDGIYTFNNIHSDSIAPGPFPGPIVVRIFADVTASIGLRHATDIDVAPFFLLATGPGAPPPQVSALNPASAAPGTQVTISGSGFDSTAANDVVILGNRVAQVATASSTQLVVVVPSDLVAGTVPVTVSAGGQSSNAVSLTVAAR